MGQVVDGGGAGALCGQPESKAAEELVVELVVTFQDARKVEAFFSPRLS